MMRRPALVLAATVALVSTAQAQRAGTFEVGLFPNIAYFDKTLRLDQGSAGPGGRIGFFITDNWMLEGEASYTPTDPVVGDGRIAHVPIRGRIAYNFPAGEHTAFILGAGFAYTMYRRDADFEDSGPTASAGVRLGLGDVTSIRINTYVDYIPSPENQVKENWNWGIQPGLSFLLGNRGAAKVRDKDADGVPDAVDECKDTPAGEKVDAKGCTIKDADGDGVLDDADQCADTPAGEQVDAKGCPLPKDADNDGVADDADKCAGTPAGEEVDASGCSATQRDADGDGVNDATDTCADTPAGEQVDAKGCPLPKDGDQDGVTDDKDRCPSTPAGVTVDEEGCQVLFEEEKKTLILEGVNFETGKSTLTPESEAILNGVAESLVANEEIRVQVGGHTDNTGSLALNRRLSKARAEAVRQYLIGKGVAENRLTAVGFGPDRPVASNRTAEGRAQNRRVELTRLN
ncbi:MAG TPA: OmpA family protein [Phycisphaerales bacterium]|nr:OmpA family protein [Phycisphaerales bacterium]